MAGAIAEHRRNCKSVLDLMKNPTLLSGGSAGERVVRAPKTLYGGLHRLRERDRGCLRKCDVEVDLLLLQRFNDQSCRFGIHSILLASRKEGAAAASAAAAPVSADI